MLCNLLYNLCFGHTFGFELLLIVTLSKNLKSSINYGDVKIEKLDKDTNRILVSDDKKTPELNAVLKQVNKFKLNIIEASFVKSNLEEIFRKITTTNASS